MKNIRVIGVGKIRQGDRGKRSIIKSFEQTTQGSAPKKVIGDVTLMYYAGYDDITLEMAHDYREDVRCDVEYYANLLAHQFGISVYVVYLPDPNPPEFLR